MPPEQSAATPAAAPNDISFDDAIALMADDPATEQPPAPKAPTEEPKPDDEVSDIEVPEEEIVKEDEAAKAAATLADDTVIDLGDGKTANLAELKQAKASFEESRIATTQALQEVAKERSNLHTLGANMAQALENVSNYLVKRLPPEPSAQLAYSDPAEHYRQTIVRNNAIAELQDMLSVAEGSKQAVAMLSDSDFKAQKAQEDQKWIAAMPTLKDPTRFTAADNKAKAHAKALGFSEEEVNATADHRLRSTFWEAARYREIMANAKNAKGKVENASIMAPPKARTQHPNSQAALANVNARKVLAKTGKLEDALKLNW